MLIELTEFTRYFQTYTYTAILIYAHMYAIKNETFCFRLNFI